MVVLIEILFEHPPKFGAAEEKASAQLAFFLLPDPRDKGSNFEPKGRGANPTREANLTYTIICANIETGKKFNQPFNERLFTMQHPTVTITDVTETPQAEEEGKGVNLGDVKLNETTNRLLSGMRQRAKKIFHLKWEGNKIFYAKINLWPTILKLRPQASLFLRLLFLHFCMLVVVLCIISLRDILIKTAKIIIHN
ncbi:MAG: hypothetical protein WCO09_02835 [bacterium]